jgi:hypothetical protein
MKIDEATLLKNYEKQTQKYKGLQGEAKELSPEFMKQLKEQPVIMGDQEVRKYKIVMEVIKKDEPLTVVSMRNWMMMGYKPLKVCFNSSRLIHKLKKDNDLLMSDSPQEMFLQYKAYKNAKGRVLTSGLGIGLFPSMVAKKKEVTEIVVIEIDNDVIKLLKASPHLKNRKIKIIQGDIWKFLKTTKEKFDYIYIDIHYSTGGREYYSVIQPMKLILNKKFPKVPVDFWGQDEIEAQVTEEIA